MIIVYIAIMHKINTFKGRILVIMIFNEKDKNNFAKDYLQFS